jgi:hypothetical protein
MTASNERAKRMFSVGQTVYHKTSSRSGVVLECDGDRVYIAQPNGAEADFRSDELSATPAVASKPSGYTMAARVLTIADVGAEHRKVLAIVAPQTIQAVAALFERRPGSGKFGALDVAEKLNFIADVTAVPYRTMKEFSDRPGILRLMMGKGLADSQRRLA